MNKVKLSNDRPFMFKFATESEHEYLDLHKAEVLLSQNCAIVMRVITIAKETRSSRPL